MKTTRASYDATRPARRLTYANIMSTAAVVLLLVGGGAAVAGAPLALLVIILINSFVTGLYLIFQSTVWTLTYLEVQKPSSEDILPTSAEPQISN